MNRRSALSLIVAAPAAAPLLAQSDPWRVSDLMQPADLAARLNGAKKPLVLFVGFPVLYRSTRIKGALMAGPGNKPDGLALLKKTVEKMPKDAELVLYCGCCPFVQCPNVRPAYTALRNAGHTNVKVVAMPTNMATDWVAKGYPIEKAANTPGR